MEVLARIVPWVAWNSLLAVIPVVLAYVIWLMAGTSRKRGLVLVPILALGLVWLAFLPNTCYLLTEWRHYLAAVDRASLYSRALQDSGMTLLLMKHTVFYFCFSGIGVLTFALAIRPVAHVAKSWGVNLWLMGPPLFLLLSVGVYLGLILRYNSWDLITQPGNVFSSIATITSRPTLSAIIFAFGAFLWLAYVALDIWIDGLLLRWRQTFPPKKTSQATG